MHRALAIATMLLPLAGCGDKPDSGEKTAADITAPGPVAATPLTLQPGKWQTTSELVKMEVPGMPAELAKANIGQKTTFEHCLTAEQAAKPSSDFFTNNRQTTDCTTKNFAMTGGKLDATMTCIDKKSKTEMVMTIKGDYQPTSYNATTTMVTNGAPAGGDMKITANTSSKRLGDCDAKTAS